MNVAYINPIYDATNEVFQQILQVEIERGQLGVKEDTITTNQANISIGVTGDLKGSIVFSFSEQMALEIVTQMSGMEMDKLDKFVTSAVGELANIISGHAMTNLSEKDYQCDIVPPQIIIGENKTISMATEKILTIPMKTEIGGFELNISVSES